MKVPLVCVFSILFAGSSLCDVSKNESKLTKKIRTGYVDIETKDNRIVLVIRKSDGRKISASLYTKYPGSMSNESLKIEQDCERLTTCIQLGNRTHARIKTDPEKETVQVNRSTSTASGQLADCFALTEDVLWFGGPERRIQHWPVQNTYVEDEAYLPSHPQHMGVAERYWVTSSGVYLLAAQREPLFLDQNNLKDRHLCLVAKNSPPYQRRDEVTLSYEIGVFADTRAAHLYVVDKHFDKPKAHPSELMVGRPVWSTWPRFQADVNESRVREFARQIGASGLGASQIEIDDKWETCYGSAKFDPAKFPSPRNLTGDLKALGFRVALWVHPFVNKGCNGTEGGYDSALQKGYFVKNEKGEVRTSWWQGSDAAVVDFTNPKAVDWWVGRLKKLQKESGVDGFKFDAGEESWLPKGRPQLSGDKDLLPGAYSREYATILAERFGDSAEVRVGWRTQGLPVFVRMIDKDSRWTWNNGLPTLVTTLLQMNLNGYVFVLPDVVGGNGYVEGQSRDTRAPSKELFIRWMQATVFMPVMQYSFAPWDYDNETIEISKKFTDLHAQYAPKMIELMKKAVKTGTPINLPVWWLEPSNAKALRVNDQFLLGEEILVAPILEEGARSRYIYLPPGQWRDPRTQIDYAGPMEYHDYPAPLDVLPYFIKS
ncbi:myogenesis-regulating glycosidase [Copidosoma floridanum]|uniref:myogenesis-regulating glycosidase n=1 Tax=Copidosoma floridanum TaxID=29053 RepID=UPI0006C990DC|nr:myogenesis-regulating glycosidase [Copidosoma floridanum]